MLGQSTGCCCSICSLYMKSFARQKRTHSGEVGRQSRLVNLACQYVRTPGAGHCSMHCGGTSAVPGGSTRHDSTTEAPFAMLDRSRRGERVIFSYEMAPCIPWWGFF